MQPPLSECVARSVLISICRFEMRIFDLMLKMSPGHQFQCAVVVFLVAESRLLSVDQKQILQLFRLFNLHLVQILPYMLSVSLSVTADDSSSHFVSKA